VNTATAANLLYGDVEEDLRASVRGLLASRCAPADLLRRVESDQRIDLDLWRTLATQVGVTGLPVPEELGGQGASAREVAVVLEELGRSLAPVPFLASSVLATNALLAAGPGAAGVLRAVAEGERTAALAVPFTAWPDVEPTVRATGGGLTGTVRSVAGADVADVFVVPVAGPHGVELHAVDAAAPSAVAVTEAVPLDLTRPVADVSFDGAASTTLTDDGAAAVRAALLAGAGLLASEQVGIADYCLESTVEYVKQRYQFGRPVGSFQALKHRLADLFGELAVARAAARYAADTLANGDPDAAVAVSVAQSLCASTAVHAAEEAVQLHGGIGMTWEHPAHLYLKRAKANELALGTPGRHRASLAELVDLPGPQ